MQKSRCAPRRRAAVLSNIVVHVICAKLELHWRLAGSQLLGSATRCNAPSQDSVASISGTGDAPAPVKVTHGLIDGLPDDLTEHERNQVVHSLQEYDSIFWRGPYDMGCTSLVEHTTVTGNHRPIRQGLRRHPIAHSELIYRHCVNVIVRHNRVEPATSPLASNVVLVRTKDGSCWLCVDYRTLNSCYPIRHLSAAAYWHLFGFSRWCCVV